MLKKILIILAALVGVGALAVAIFLPIKLSKEKAAMEEEYQEQISVLQGAVDDYGTLDTVYVLNQKVVAGQEVSMDQLTPMEQPTSLITTEFVRNDADLKSTFYTISMNPGTPITYSVVSSDIVTHQDRYIDVTAHVFPVYMKQGDFVDFRIVTDYGQDYLVLSKKRIIKKSDNSVQLILNEEELHRYQSAVVDTYLHAGAALYCATYVEPAFQKEAQPYYPVSQDVLNAMLIDPNIKQVAELEIIEKRRERFESDLEKHQDNQQNSAVATGRTASLDKLREDIEAYNQKITDGIIDPKTGLVVTEEVPEDEAAATPPPASSGAGNASAPENIGLNEEG